MRTVTSKKGRKKLYGEGLSTGAQPVKPPLGTPTAPMVTSASNPPLLLNAHLGRHWEMALIPGSLPPTWETQVEVLGTWLQPDPVLATVCILGVKQQMKDLPLSAFQNE